mmetsp:Transcript_20037/g.42182  ORF Transcript_20037/g.42182 Transcript_20037/m.42182 type:complete len:244 (+) Transcript_20037:1429-2160(+)
MSEVVRRVDAPLVTDVRVADVLDSVRHLIEHVEVGRGHVHFHAEARHPLVKLPQLHIIEKLEVLLHARLAVRRAGVALRPLRVARLEALRARLSVLLGHLTAHLNLLRLLEAHVGIARLDQLDGEGVQIVEALAGVGGPGRRPPHPFHVFIDRLDVLITLGLGVRVVVTEHGLATLGRHPQLFERQRKVHIHGLGVSDVKVAIRLRREAGAHDATSIAGILGFVHRVLFGRGHVPILQELARR